MRIFPTRIAIEQSSSHAYLVQVLKREIVFKSALCTLHSEHLPPAAKSNSRPPSVPKRATCSSKTKLARSDLPTLPDQIPTRCSASIQDVPGLTRRIWCVDGGGVL